MHFVHRRDFLRTSALGVSALMAPRISWAEANDIAESFDAEMEAFMGPRKIPGGALAVAKNGRLVYAKGYGLADRDKGTAVGNESLFRIASISKPITAVAVLQLVEAGHLKLDANPFELLGFELAKAA